MYLGYILDDNSFPLLQQLDENQISDFEGDKPLLIVGYNKAVKLFGKKVSLNTRVIDQQKQIYYAFSREESETNYLEQTAKFFKRVLATTTDSVVVTNVIDPKRIELDKLKGQKVFLHETDNIITISALNQIYLFNKEISTFFNEQQLTTDVISTLLSECEVWSWDRFRFFGARLKSNLCYKSKDQLRYLLEPYCDIELYMGTLCLKWMSELLENKHEQVWQDAYETESYLSQLPIKIDRKLVLMLSYQSDNTLFEGLLKQEEKGYVIQHYNGTDKTTGRMYAKGSGYSIQTLPKNVRQIIVAEPECYLVEFDYKYFEYSLLEQMCNIPSKGDPHKRLALEYFNDASYRHIGKEINYGTIYGKSIESTVSDILAENQLNYTEEELIKKLTKLRKPFDKLRNKLMSELRFNGYVVNPFGRQIVPEKQWAILNNYVQSTAADMVIRKLLKIKKFLSNFDNLNRVVLQKHDSILFNLRELDVEENDIALSLKRILEEPEANLYGKVTLVYGTNWRDLD